jgi:hypothetical protein
LIKKDPEFSDLIEFTEETIKDFDAVIATGSNNTARYFTQYFGKYPHIFRQNRNGVAVLSGKESKEELAALADDVFFYFGMGCRNVAKVYVPEGYSFNMLFEEMEKYLPLIEHHKYANNYQYQRSVYLINQVEHLDNGFILIRQDPHISSPVATLHFENYTDMSTLAKGLHAQQDSIQCIAGRETAGFVTVDFGRTQHPEPWDYADNVDTLNFLLNLYEN